MKTRIISGAVGIALLVAVLWFRTTIVFNIAVGLIAALMVYELCRAEKLEKEYALVITGVLFAIACPILVKFYEGSALNPYIIAASAYIVIWQTVLLWRHKNVEIGRFFAAEAYTLLITFSMTCFAHLAKDSDGFVGLIPIILTCLGAWVADSGAYFAGTFLGKHKLCPDISPKKTVEGLIGGAIANAVVFGIIPLFMIADKPVIIGCIAYAVIGVICCFLGLLGDLTASLIKRDCGIKDYGNIMPGHGGALDRFDSIIYIAPFIFFIFGGL